MSKVPDPRRPDAEEAERGLTRSGYDHLFGGHWLGAGKDDDDDDPVS